MVSPSETRSHGYRIASARYPPFDGAGAYRYGSRWVSPGHWVVHAAESYALALLENLVHWQTLKPPPNLIWIAIDIPGDVAQETVGRADLAELDTSDYAAFRRIGDAWLERGETGVLWVPSVVSPVDWNVLFNQEHAAFARLVVGEPVPVVTDARPWKTNAWPAGSAKLSCEIPQSIPAREASNFARARRRAPAAKARQRLLPG